LMISHPAQFANEMAQAKSKKNSDDGHSIDQSLFEVFVVLILAEAEPG